MRCYEHESVEAVGLCKSCMRAVCRQCGVDMGKGLACRGRCEADVKALIALVDASLRQSGTARGLMEGARRTGLIAAAFFTLLGALFVWYGIRSHAGFDLMSIMGAALLVYGAVHFMRMRRIAPVPKTPAP